MAAGVMMQMLLGGAEALKELTQKGYGHVIDAGDTADLAMGYGTVDSGSAPAAGDLVIWFFNAGDTVGSPVVDLTGSGWVQSSSYVSTTYAGTILAKVVDAGDLSSPPTVISAPTLGSIGFWVAYTVGGTIASLSVSTLNGQYAGTSAVSNQSCDSSALSAPDQAITLAVGSGTDDAITTAMSGATADITLDVNNQWNTNTVDSRFLVNRTIGGAAITISQPDEGTRNILFSGFVTVDF